MIITILDFIIKYKPEGRIRAYRFFFLTMALSSLLMVSTTLQSVGKVADTTTKRIPVTTQAVTAERDKDAVFMDGVREKMIGNTNTSFDYFQRYLKYNPHNATAHYELARIWLDRNHIPNALKEIRQAHKIDADNKWIHSLYADLLAYDGQYLLAANEFSQLAKKERSPEDYLIRQAMLYQKAEKYQEAINVLDTLSLFIGQDDEVLLLQKQQMYLQNNDVAGAALQIKKLIDYYPATLQYPLMLADLYLNNNQEEKAAVLFEQLDKEYPERLEVQYGLMQYYLKINDTARLNHMVVRTLTNKQINMTDRIDLLIPFIQKNNTNASERTFGKQLAYMLASEEPPQAPALMLYGDLLTVERLSDSALIYYKRVTEIDTTNFLAWQQILLNYAASLQMDSVAWYGKKAIERFPGEPVAYYFTGIAHSQLQEHEAAISNLHKALELQADDNEPLKSEMYSTMGDAYNAINNHIASDSCYEAALKLMPDNTTALNNYSYYLSLRGERLEAAAAMSLRSLRLRPDEPTFLDTYGWILFQQRKYKEAKVQIVKAIKLSGAGTDGTLFEHLGDIEFKLGNRDAALAAWEKAVKLGGVSSVITKKIKDKQWYE